MNPKSVQALRTVAAVNLVCGPEIGSFAGPVGDEIDIRSVKVEVIQIRLSVAVGRGGEEDGTGIEFGGGR